MFPWKLIIHVCYKLRIGCHFPGYLGFRPRYLGLRIVVCNWLHGCEFRPQEICNTVITDKRVIQ